MSLFRGVRRAGARVADQLDFIPGFDPVKDQRGVISQISQSLTPSLKIDERNAYPQPQGGRRGIFGFGNNQPEPQQNGAPQFEPLKLGILEKFRMGLGGVQNARAAHLSKYQSGLQASQSQKSSALKQMEQAERIKRLMGVGLNEQQATMAAMNPQEAAKSFFNPTNVDEGNRLYNPVTGQQVMGIDPAYQKSRDFGDQTDRMNAEASMLRAQRPDAPLVVNNTGAQTDNRPIVASPEKGYQRIYDAESNSYRDEPIPGSSVGREADELNTKAFQKYQADVQRFDTVINNIDDALKQTGHLSSSFLGQITEGIGGSPSRNLKAKLDAVKANIGFEELQKMRENSPTGGALGQVTEKELAFLQGVLGSLDQFQNPEQLKEILGEIKTSLTNLREARELYYSLQQRNATSGQIAPNSGPPTSNDLPEGFAIIE